jgi:hypothetical protein
VSVKKEPHMKVGKEPASPVKEPLWWEKELELQVQLARNSNDPEDARGQRLLDTVVQQGPALQPMDDATACLLSILDSDNFIELDNDNDDELEDGND